MGLTVKNKTVFELTEEVTDFFSIPKEETEVKENYNDLKNKIYLLDIDNEEKANILNKISLYSSTKSVREKNKLKKEIEEFKSNLEL